MSHKYFLVSHHQLKEAMVLAVMVSGITLRHVASSHSEEKNTYLMNNNSCSLYHFIRGSLEILVSLFTLTYQSCCYEDITGGLQ